MQDKKGDKPGPDFIAPLIEWLSTGAPAAPRPDTEQLVTSARALRAAGDTPKTIADKLNVSVAEVVSWTSVPS